LHIRKGPHQLLQLIAAIFNFLLRTEYIPTTCKTSKSLMFLKPNKPPDSVTSYRPIQLTPTLGKILERIVVKRFYLHLQKRHLLQNHQAGFRPTYSIQYKLLRQIFAIKLIYATFLPTPPETSLVAKPSGRVPPNIQYSVQTPSSHQPCHESQQYLQTILSCFICFRKGFRQSMAPGPAQKTPSFSPSCCLHPIFLQLSHKSYRLHKHQQRQLIPYISSYRCSSRISTITSPLFTLQYGLAHITSEYSNLPIRR